MDSTKISVLEYTSHKDEGYYHVLETYDDGTRLIEGYIYLSEVPADLRIVLTIFATGITFENGSIEMVLTADDFDGNGVARYRIIMPQTYTATCHHINFYQGNAYLNNFDNF